MRRLLPALAVLASAVFAAPASADTFDVIGRGDSGGGCTAIGVQSFQCASLRDAVAAASTGREHAVILHAGSPYVLSGGQLSITSGQFVLAGENARSTVIQAGTGARVLALSGTADVTLANVTVQGGSATSATGGNLLTNAGTTLSLLNVRVTGGTANAGAGIANSGSLAILNSLIDNNVAGSAGGGILNDGSASGAAELDVLNSTIAFNRVQDGTGAGIQTEGNLGNTVTLAFATVARNFGNGLSGGVTPPQTVDATASIIAANNGLSCSGVSFSSAQFNLDDATSCGFSPANNRPQTSPQLAGELSNQGGQTDVLAFQTASSPAIDYVTPCFGGTDQRGYTRVTNPGQEPCDAGAFELSGTPPSQPPPPPPVPTPVPPQPTPTATPTETPVANKSVAAEEVKGTVLIKVNGKFVPFEDDVINNGTELDTRKGTVEITTSEGGKAKFFDGIFKVSQTRGLTTLTLTEALDCSSNGKARAAAKKPKSRKLWGDGKGKFRTKGKYSAATVRGTKWLVKDTCTTTTTTVTQGVVQVEDFAKKRKVTVRKGAKPYVARKK